MNINSKLKSAVRLFYRTSYVFLALQVTEPLMAQEMCPKGFRVSQLEEREADLGRQANNYRNSGMGFEYREMLDRVRVAQGETLVAYLEQGLMHFRLTRDPRCAIASYNRITGEKINVQPYADGTWDFLSDGKVVRKK